METVFKPDGYNSVSPYFIVPEAQKFIDMVRVIFDGTELRRYERPDGSIMHAEVQIDDSVIMLGEASEKYPAVPIVLHVYVANVDDAFNKAIHLGCEIIDTPKSRDGDPDRRATFKDYAGYMWSVATQQLESKKKTGPVKVR